MSFLLLSDGGRLLKQDGGRIVRTPASGGSIYHPRRWRMGLGY